MAFLDNAIQAHGKWKVKLMAAVKREEIPDRSTAGNDLACDLGKWIHGEGGRLYGGLPEFQKMQAAHKRFHTAVGKILDLVKAEKMEQARHEIEEGEFQTASREVSFQICQLKAHVKE